MNTKDLAIGTLSVTAVILFVGLVITQMSPPPALAVGQIDRGGDYTMLTGQVTADEEVLYVLDSAIPRLTVYAFNISMGRLVPQDQFHFGGRPGPVPNKRGRGR